MIRFGPYRIDIPQRQLLRGEQPLKIENIPLDIRVRKTADDLAMPRKARCH